MRVHPAPRKRNITFRYDVIPSLAAAAGAPLGRQKKLRRLPHVFSKVLELPLGSDADVSVQEDPVCFRFVAATEEVGGEVEARAVRIHPGVMKVVVVRDGGVGDLDGELDLDRWRFRLPPSTRPALATAAYADGQLLVTVPKGAGPEEEDEAGEGEVFGEDFMGGGIGIGRLVAVQ